MNKNYETPDILGVKALDNYFIYLKYEANEERIYNMENLINENKFYAKLKDKTYFKNVKLRGDSIEWENGEDVAPENLYYDSIDINEFQGIIKELD
jgi:hypothetical protein